MGALESLQNAEILIPHEVGFRPTVAVRNTVIQASLAELREAGYFDRYAKNIDPSALGELESNMGPSWVPIELADVHYAACEAMQLDDEELRRVGEAVGIRVRQTSIIVPDRSPTTPVDVWPISHQLHRVWKRIYQGGSVQTVKLGPTEELIEFRGFTLNRHHYYRFANLAAISAALEAIGVRIETAKIIRYDAATHEVVIRLVWS